MKSKNGHNKSLAYDLADLQKLREDMHRALDLRFDQFQQKSKVVEILPDSNKIVWLRGLESLFTWYELLVQYKYVECNFTFFQAHFMGNEPVWDKIVFLQPTNQLPYIMDCLQGDYIAECKHPHVRLAQHFCDRFGNPISNTVLRASLDKGPGKKAKKFIEENIIGKLKNHIG